MKLKSTVFLAIAFLIIQLFLFLQSNSDHNLQIQFIDVGQGDSILITTPNKQLILIDGGPDTNSNLESVIGSKFFFSACTINTIVATHPHADHINGLTKILESCEVSNIFLTNMYYENPDYVDFLQKVKDENATVKYVETNDKFTIDGVSFLVLWPDYKVLKDSAILNCPTLQTCTTPTCLDKTMYDLLSTSPVNCKNPNYVSIVLKMTYKNFDTLLTGDAEEPILEKLNLKEKIEVLKVPHHGASDSLDKALIDKISPYIAVISAGKNNVYKHPHTQVLGAYSDRKITTLQTDEKGTISIKSDGDKFWVE
jgi:competence protein ComEC